MAAPAAPPTTPKRWHPRYLIVGLAVVLAVVFIAQNRERTDINLFSIEVSGPLWLTLALMTLLGVAIGALVVRRR